jgi:hypothetical protein
MTLELAFNEDCLDFKKQLDSLTKQFPTISYSSYDENHYSDKKKAYKLKGGYSARMTPFALFKDDTHVIPFYSESDDCNLDNIKEILNRYCHD